MKRKPLSKKEIKELNVKIEKFDIKLDKKARIEIIDDKYYFMDNEIIFFILDDIIIPTLKFLLKNPKELPTAIVDMGAIKFIANGADVMRPGIKEFVGEINKGDFVVIIDENNKKPLVIGRALTDKEELEKQESGKALENIHYIGDDIWNFQI